VSNVHRTSEQISEPIYRDRFLTRLTAKFETEQHFHFTPARSLAVDIYEHCPQPQMAEEYVANPEGAADEAYTEWLEDLKRDDGEPYEDDEWDGDEDRE
jgi:hypothetical protein